jgi:hypothetical protein
VKSLTRTLGIFAAVAALMTFSVDAYAQTPAATDAEANASAVIACMDKGKSEGSQSSCVMGIALIKAIEVLGQAQQHAGTPMQATAPQVIVQPNGRTAWDVFANMVSGIFQFGKETLQSLGPVAAQVYAARTNAHTQEVVAGYQRDSTIAGYQAFTTMGGSIERAGTAGYQYVQAPGAVTTNTLSGTGVLGSGAYTGPVSTTTTTTRTCTTGSAGSGGGTTTGAPGGASGGASC